MFVLRLSNFIPSATNAIVAGGDHILNAEYHYHNLGALKKIKAGRAKSNYRKAATPRSVKLQWVSTANHEDEC